MTEDLLAALRPLLAQLETYLASRPELRQELAVVARAVADALVPPLEAKPPTASPPVQPAAEPRPVSAEPTPVEPPELTPAFVRPAPVPTAPRPVVAEAADEPDTILEPEPPGVIAARCRVKGDAARLVADRFGGGAAAGTPLTADLIARAGQLPECFLWMLQPGTYSESRAAWDELAGAFLAAAAAADMLRTWLDLPAEEASRYAADVLPLAAEAQSTLLTATVGVGRRGYDQDQLELFVTVREEARARAVYIRRYLRREDRADPSSAPELARRIGELATTIQDRTTRAAERKKLLGNLRYKLSRLKADPDGNADQWPRVIEMIDRLVADGLQPSNPELRDMLLPLVERMPAGTDLPRFAGLVFREVGRYLDSRPEADEPGVEVSSAEVEEVAGLIGGRELVLIGGERRPQHEAALVRAFRLADLNWIVTPEHESYHSFEPAVRRPETAVVVLAIRWSSHSYSEVRRYCEENGKPLVRLPGGYNANQLAHQILAQVGDQLRAGTSG